MYSYYGYLLGVLSLWNTFYLFYLNFVFQFLTELTKLFQSARSSGAITVSMKRCK